MAYRAEIFDGEADVTTGYSTRKPFRPEMDLRTAGFYDPTIAADQTVVVGAGSIPKLTALAGLVGANLTTLSTSRAPAAKDQAGSLGIVWRADATAEGVAAMMLPPGLLSANAEAMIAFVLSHGVAPADNSRLLDLSADATNTGRTLTIDFNAGLLGARLTSTGTRNVCPITPIGSTYVYLLHFSGGKMRQRINGVEVASIAYAGGGSLLPVGGSGSIGGGFDGGSFGFNITSNTAVKRALFVQSGQIPSVSAGDVDVERDRNSAAYWEAALAWAAGIQASLPDDHPFKAAAPVTTWLGERV